MRPIKLEMTAFGSYKDTATIEFDKIGSGIYAITGPTGAGKTTIFDAIMFALYEEVSAKGVDSKSNPVDADSVRSKTMVRSRYADMKTDTVVKLEFEERGKRYTVERKMHVTPATVKSPKVTSAELTGDDIPAIEKSTNVTNEIIRILGDLNAARFRQIVMLAQGQFKAFMEAKDEQRKDILSKLFDGTPYRIFQERLKDAAEQLKEEKKEADSKIRAKFEPDVFLLPENMPEEERALYSPDLPTKDLEANLRSLIASDEEAERELKNREEDLSKQKDDLNRRVGAAQQANKLYQEMVDLEARLNELQNLKGKMEHRKAAFNETEAALHVVKPIDDTCKAKEKDLQNVLKGMTETAVSLDNAAARKEAAEEAMKGNADRERRANEAKTLADRYGEHLKEFEMLSKAEADQAEGKTVLEQLSHTLEEISKDKADTQSQVNSLEEELAALSDAGAEEVKAQQVRDRAQEVLNRLTDRKNGLQGQFEALAKDEKVLGKLLTKAQDRAVDEKKAADAYAALHQRYLEGYAGKLCIELKRTIQEEGQGYCPVCGTHFTSQEAIKGALSEAGLSSESTHIGDSHIEEMVSEEALQKAEEVRDKASAACKRATDEFNIAKASFETSKDALLTDLLSELPNLGPWIWDVDAIRQKMGQAMAERSQACMESEAALGEAGKKVAHKKRIETSLKEMSDRLEGLKKTENEKREQQIKAAADQEGYISEIKRLKGALKDAGMDSFTDEEEAKEALNNLLRQVKELKDENDRCTKEYAEAEKEVATYTKEHAEREKQSNDLRDALQQVYSDYDQAVKQAGFMTERSYFKAIARILQKDDQSIDFMLVEAPDVSTQQGQAWLENERGVINRYDNELDNTSKRLAELKEKPPVYTDLSALQGEEGVLKEKMEALDKEKTQFDRYAFSHRNALETLLTVSDDLAVISAAYARLNNLASVANGENSIGGKRTFDGYVLGSTFREVLAHASHYLDEMTGGKYELCHDTEGSSARKSSYANFKIMVQDALSGQQREIGSLSGGEAFQVAMALALGLSDAVQSHVSTVSIDTMFIDEGFGSLDKDSLHRMLQVLNNLSGGQRQIGIISHVDELKECVGKFIHVTGSKDKQGSRLKVEV